MTVRRNLTRKSVLPEAQDGKKACLGIACEIRFTRYERPDVPEPSRHPNPSCPLLPACGIMSVPGGAWLHCSNMSVLCIFTSAPIEGILSPCISSGRRVGARSGRRSIPGMTSSVWATPRTRPLLTLKKSGRPEASRQICIRVRPGKGASNLRNRRLRNRPLPRSLPPRQQPALRLQVLRQLSLRLPLNGQLPPQ